jgi:hypothetical protein
MPSLPVNLCFLRLLLQKKNGKGGNGENGEHKVVWFVSRKGAELVTLAHFCGCKKGGRGGRQPVRFKNGYDLLPAIAVTVVPVVIVSVVSIGPVVFIHDITSKYPCFRNISQLSASPEKWR